MASETPPSLDDKTSDEANENKLTLCLKTVVDILKLEDREDTIAAIGQTSKAHHAITKESLYKFMGWFGGVGQEWEKFISSGRRETLRHLVVISDDVAFLLANSLSNGLSNISKKQQDSPVLMTTTAWNSGKPEILCFQDIDGDALVMITANVMKVLKKKYGAKSGHAFSGLAVSIVTQASPVPFLYSMPQRTLKAPKSRPSPLKSIPYGVNTTNEPMRKRTGVSGKKTGSQAVAAPAKTTKTQADVRSSDHLPKPIKYASSLLGGVRTVALRPKLAGARIPLETVIAIAKQLSTNNKVKAQDGKEVLENAKLVVSGFAGWQGRNQLGQMISALCVSEMVAMNLDLHATVTRRGFEPKPEKHHLAELLDLFIVPYSLTISRLIDAAELNRPIGSHPKLELVFEGARHSSILRCYPCNRDGVNVVNVAFEGVCDPKGGVRPTWIESYNATGQRIDDDQHAASLKSA